MKKLVLISFFLVAAAFVAPVCVFASTSSTCVAPAPGLTSWWAAEGDASDIQGSNNGALQNGASFAFGEVGAAFSFDGASQYVRVPTSATLNPTGSFTVEAWIYPTADQVGSIVSKWGDSGDYSNQRAYYFRTDTSARLFFGISDTNHQSDQNFHSLLTNSNAITLNAWNHVAAVYDQSTGTRSIYVNGALAASRTDAPITVTNSSADVGIGASVRSSTSVQDYFHGMLDEVDFYSRSLSPSEIQSIYGAGGAGKCQAAPPACAAPPQGITSWWRGEGNANDSLSGNDGLIQGGFVYGPGKVGAGFKFNGTSQFVRIPNSASLNPTASFSVEAWIYPTANNNGTILSKWADTIVPFG